MKRFSPYSILFFVYITLFVFACPECVPVENGNGENGNGEDAVITIETIASDSARSKDYEEMQIVVDAEGGLHGVFYDEETQEVMYAHRSPGGTWTVERIVSSDEARHESKAAIGIDSMGVIHIVYGEYHDRELRHASRTGNGDFSDTLIDASPGNKVGISMFIDDYDRIHVACGPANNDFRYASKERNGEWSSEAVHKPRNSGFATAITVDEDDTIHYLHYADNHLYYLSRHINDDEWSEPEVISERLGSLSSGVGLGITQDQEGIFHVFYNDGQSEGNTRYLRKAPGDEFSEVSPGLSRTAYMNRGICAALSGGAFITFQPFSNWSMSAVFIDNDEKISEPFIVDIHGDTRMGAHSDCAVDSEGNLHVMYNQTSTGHKALKYAFVPAELLP